MEKSANNLETKLNKIGEKKRKLEGEVNDLSKSMEYANAEIEDVNKNGKENVVKTNELEDTILNQEVYNRRASVFQNLLMELRIRMKLYENSLAMNWRWKTQQILNSRELTE